MSVQKVRVYKKHSQMCVICLGDNDDTTVKCGHTFHSACLARWQAETNACPVCRAPIDASRPTCALRCDSTLDDRAVALRLALEDEVAGEQIVGQCLTCESFIYEGEMLLRCTHCNQMSYCSPLCRALDFRRHHTGECVPHARCRACHAWVPRDTLLACGVHCERPECRRTHFKDHFAATHSRRKRQRTEGL